MRPQSERAQATNVNPEGNGEVDTSNKSEEKEKKGSNEEDKDEKGVGTGLAANVEDLSLEGDDSDQDDSEDEEGANERLVRRGILYRQFIKEKILGHPLWQDGNYWEQALWQCAIEQVMSLSQLFHPESLRNRHNHSSRAL
jgi:hypothetical protein